MIEAKQGIQQNHCSRPSEQIPTELPTQWIRRPAVGWSDLKRSGSDDCLRNRIDAWGHQSWMVTTGMQWCHDKGRERNHFVSTTQRLTAQQPVEDTLIDALRGCRRTEELQSLEQRLAQDEGMPPLFDWICDLLVQRRISRALGARLLKQLHNIN